MGIPEVSQVFGKAGRAETATDPAPVEMFETVINLKPESQWRPGMDVEKLKNEMNDALQIPGFEFLYNAYKEPYRYAGHRHQDACRVKVLGRNWM